MRTKLILLLSLFLTAALALGETPHGQSPQVENSAKPVISKKGKPLVALLKPGQTELLVEKDQAAPHAVQPPPGMSQLEWVASVAPVVAIVRVDVTQPTLTADEDWIETTVRARVEEILKKPETDNLAVGQSIEFMQDGGETIISGTRVRATLPWAESFHEGARYLVFAQRDDSAKRWLIDPASTYEIDPTDEKLKPLARRGKARSEAGVSISNASARIRAARKP